jgi:PKD domain
MKSMRRIPSRLFALVLLGVVAVPATAALPPLCEDVCGPQVACSTPCRDAGVRKTCGKYGECSGTTQVCPTVVCAAGCATKPSFTVSNTTPVIGEAITFTADTSNINSDTTNWDLGDGTHAFGVSVTHAYSSAATFRACLSANETTCDTVQTACKYISVPGGGGGGGGCAATLSEVPCVADPLLRLGDRGALVLPAACRHVAVATGAGWSGQIECRGVRVRYDLDSAPCTRDSETVRLAAGMARACVTRDGGEAELAVTLPEHGLALRASVASPDGALLLWQLAGSFLP